MTSTGRRVVVAIAACASVATAACGTSSDRAGPSRTETLPTFGGSDHREDFPVAAAAGWGDPGHFPIGIWSETAYNSVDLRELGINVIVGAIDDGADLAALGDESGMHYIVDYEWSPERVARNPFVVGWMAQDECDMGFGVCATADGDGAAIVEAQRRLVDRLRRHDDGRFVYANYGKGVLGTWWNPENLPALVDMVDVASADLYFATDPNLATEAPMAPSWPPGADPADPSSYGWTVDRMESFAAGTQPTWQFVELGHPFTDDDAPTITPDQVEAAVWSSIVHGAQGLVYFNHSFGGDCQTQHVIFDCGAEMNERVAAINRQVAELAPVLDEPDMGLPDGFVVASAIDTMVKADDRDVYVFASLGQSDVGGEKRFVVPPGVDGSTVEVLGEDRTLTVTAGSFVDRVSQDQPHHVYRISR